MSEETHVHPSRYLETPAEDDYIPSISEVKVHLGSAMFEITGDANHLKQMEEGLDEWLEAGMPRGTPKT